MQKSSNKIRKNFKGENRGITLIALVITIIVLLLLAGISISMLSGNNGILTQVQSAKESTRAGEVQEIVALEAANNAGDKYLGRTKKTRTQVISELHEQGKLTDAEVEELQENNVIKIGNVTIDFSELGSISNANTLVAMYEQAESDNCTNQDGTCTNENHLHIGDYVNYKNPTSGTYTVLDDQSGVDWAQRYDVALNPLNWRVMGKDSSTGKIKIMASQPMKKSNDGGTALNDNPYLYMKGAESYTNSLEQLENICKMYTTSYGKARSITLDDVNALTGVNTTDLKKQYNLETYEGLKNLGESYSYNNQYTPDSWLNGNTPTTVSGTVTGYSYTVNSSISDGLPYVAMSNTRAYNMLFNNTEIDERKSNCGRYYWLASLGMVDSGDVVMFGTYVLGDMFACKFVSPYKMFFSDGHEEQFYAAVCPVVVLEPNVTKDDVSKVEDKTETGWNYNLRSLLN